MKRILTALWSKPTPSLRYPSWVCRIDQLSIRIMLPAALIMVVASLVVRYYDFQFDVRSVEMWRLRWAWYTAATSCGLVMIGGVGFAYCFYRHYRGRWNMIRKDVRQQFLPHRSDEQILTGV